MPARAAPDLLPGVDRRARRLLELARRLQVAVNAAGVGIHAFDVTAGTIAWDARVRALWGVGANLPITYEVFRSGVDPRDLPEVERRVQAALAPEGDHRYDARYRVRPLDGGAAHWVHATGLAFFENGRATRLIGTVQDITARMEAETRLQDSELRFRAVQDTSLDGFMVLESVRDSDGRIVDFTWAYVNEAAARIVGRPVAAFLGQRLLGLMPGNRTDGLFDAYVQVVETGQAWTREFSYAHDGVDVFLRTSAAKAGDGFAVSFADLSERRRHELALEERERRFVTLADTMPQLVWASTADGRVDFRNAQWLAYAGAGLDDDADPLARIVHPEDIGFTRSLWGEALASGSAFEVTCRLRRHDGAWLWFLTRATPQRDARGDIERWIGTCTNVDDARRSQEALERSERRFRAFADRIPALAFEADADGVVRFFNQRWYDYTGLDRRASLGLAWEAALHADDRDGTVEAWRRSMRTGEPISAEYRLLRRDGQYRWHRTHASRYVDVDGQVRGWFGTGMDIHEAKSAEVLLLAQQAALQRADRLKDEFVATLAHELRNPLAPVRAAASILQHPNLDEPTRRRAVQTIDRQVGAMAVLLDDLLDIARVTQGKLQIRPVEVTLQSVLVDALELARPILDARGHVLTVDLAGLTERVMRVDPVRLPQALSNLLINAAKYTDPGGQIRVQARALPEALEIRVCDNGIGIDPEAVDRIFDMFSQQRGTLERSGGGLGIGLALVRGIAGLHGGWVRAESEGPGHGSRFTLHLPCRGPEDAPPGS